MIFPEAITPGDAIAIVTPATIVKEEFVADAATFLHSLGYVIKEGKYARGPHSGSFAATHDQRAEDLRRAWLDPEVRAILCARGGYGCIHLMETLSDEELLRDPKWLIGFSDVSALHARLHKAGIASVHASMAKHLALYGMDPITGALLDILTLPSVTQTLRAPASPLNRTGRTEGTLLGGNLAVLNSLAGTPWDMLNVTDADGPVILFLEDVSEKIYAVERMLMRLVLSGSLHRIAGLAVGWFTDYKADANYPDMEHMIDALLRRYGIAIPVAYGFPIGHKDTNRPLVEGARASLSVTEEGGKLTFTTQP